MKNPNSNTSRTVISNWFRRARISSLAAFFALISRLVFSGSPDNSTCLLCIPGSYSTGTGTSDLLRLYCCCLLKESENPFKTYFIFVNTSIFEYFSFSNVSITYLVWFLLVTNKYFPLKCLFCQKQNCCNKQGKNRALFGDNVKISASIMSHVNTLHVPECTCCNQDLQVRLLAWSV